MSDDKTWHPPVGKLFAREMGDETAYCVIVSEPDEYLVDTMQIARLWYGEWEFRCAMWYDCAKGRECKTGSGHAIRRRLATDEDVARLRAGLPDGFDLAAWRVRLLRDVPCIDRVDLDRLTAADATTGQPRRAMVGS